MYIAGQSSAHGALLCLVQSIVVSSSCRASHTGDAIRVMYSSVNVGVVHVLGACRMMFFSCASSSSSSSSSSSCSCCSCTTSYFRIFVGPKNRHVGGVFALFDIPGAKKLCKYRCVLRLGPKTTVFTMFLASGGKNHSIYSVDWPVPSTNTGIYVVFSMLQEELVPCQRRKRLFASTKKTANIRQKVPKIGLQKASCNFNRLFFPPRTPKNMKTPTEWRISGRSVASLSVVFEPVCAARGFDSDSSVVGHVVAMWSRPPHVQHFFSPSSWCPKGQPRPLLQTFGWPSAITSFFLACCPICSNSARRCSLYCVTVSNVGTVSTMSELLTKERRKLRSGWLVTMRLTKRPNPFIRMELSGIETPTSNALPFHLIQRLSCKITNATEFASTSASSAERMALRSVNPAGWNCSIAPDRMLSAVIYLEAINSSLSDSGRALRSSDEARLSSLDHFFCWSSGVGFGVPVNLWIGDSFMWWSYHACAVDTVRSHHISLVELKSTMWGEDKSPSLQNRWVTNLTTSTSSPRPSSLETTICFWSSCMPCINFSMIFMDCLSTPSFGLPFFCRSSDDCSLSDSPCRDSAPPSCWAAARSSCVLRPCWAAAPSSKCMWWLFLLQNFHQFLTLLTKSLVFMLWRTLLKP